MAVITFKPEKPTTAFRVLLVDDNFDFRTLITKQLNKMGCHVHATAEAGNFLAEVVTAKTPYDLAVVDLHLPDLHGDKIISWLRESEQSKVRSLPVLIVTGFPNELSQALLVDGKTIFVLSKPYRYAELENAVTRLLVGGGGIN